MSHRRKEKDAKKEKHIKVEYREEIDTPEDMEKTIKSILLQGRRNFQCPKCGCRDHILGESPDSVSLECDNCDWILNLQVPIYFGSGHDFVIGYEFVVQKDDGSPEFHYIGL